jgi:hypothetical protein
MSATANTNPHRVANPASLSLEAIAHPPLLLPGERLEDYEALRSMIICEVAPRTGIERLWTIDLIELSWDIQRYRALRHKVPVCDRASVTTGRRHRYSSRIAGGGILHSQRNAAQRRCDSAAAAEIEARLAVHGFDTRSIDMEAIVQAREFFIMFDRLVHSAQSRRIFLLREINARRSLTKRVKFFSRSIDLPSQLREQQRLRVAQA